MKQRKFLILSVSIFFASALADVRIEKVKKVNEWLSFNFGDDWPLKVQFVKNAEIYFPEDIISCHRQALAFAEEKCEDQKCRRELVKKCFEEEFSMMDWRDDFPDL